jgi:hypothetical protein
VGGGQTVRQRASTTTGVPTVIGTISAAAWPWLVTERSGGGCCPPAATHSGSERAGLPARRSRQPDNAVLAALKLRCRGAEPGRGTSGLDTGAQQRRRSAAGGAARRVRVAERACVCTWVAGGVGGRGAS